MYRLVDEPPSLDEYLDLRRSSGLSPKSPEQGALALTGSWYFCHVRSDADRAVAMGRIIGDGGWYFHVADVATLPEFQRQGLGRMVMDRLLDEIRAKAPADPYVTLVADPPGRRLYESLGFVDVAPSLGMRLSL
ncbi:GNAT family N-acetyltransferase [Promicromonospora iranensis]|uniref:Ribosomal protein S18 acetylase RimI-like enzyme n=1 Tax=Promicromonospora iranensis TaxID=1105144 RepID=A0ABU2CWK4_9MICO|nr:GNAT family N-acetyltransferase [Promicromonospora iranensis]MDR7385737.1 ribosomal protein S18 acetylase RimI-like enzyme [Promicromonospora iranensis]